MGHTETTSTNDESPKLASIDDFADHVLTYREECTTKKVHMYMQASISASGLANLLRLAYYTSQTPEEGRLLRFRCHVPAGEKLYETNLRVSFTTPVPIDTVNDLRKLAPVAGNPESALCITESDGRLFCDGVVYTRRVLTAKYIGQVEIEMTSQPMGLWLSVNGPGELSVVESPWAQHRRPIENDGSAETGVETTYSLPVLSYRAGEIRKLVPVVTIDAVASWTDEIGGVITSPNSTHSKSAGELHRRMWSRILARIVDARHGGAILVVPQHFAQGRLSHQSDLDPKFDITTCNLRERIRAFWNCSLPVDSNADAHSQGDTFITKWLGRQEELLQTVRAISDLANVDGCVVFRRDLEPVAFGAEITVPCPRGNEEQMEVECTRLGTENVQVRTTNLSEFGTRHRSALRFCMKHPNTLAFIVSQDGDLRVATSDDKGKTMLFEGVVATYW